MGRAAYVAFAALTNEELKRRLRGRAHGAAAGLSPIEIRQCENIRPARLGADVHRVGRGPRNLISVEEIGHRIACPR